AITGYSLGCGLLCSEPLDRSVCGDVCRDRCVGAVCAVNRGRQDRSPVRRIMTIYGTRPEAIKVAPIIRAIDGATDLENVVVVTGQHREMLDQVNEIFGISPDHDLNIMSNGQTLNQISSRVIAGVDDILERDRPDAVMVQGETTTVLGAAIAEANRRLPVIQIEAGLTRSYRHTCTT